MESLTQRHYENFSVLSWLVPRELRVYFARVYWFCRTADDLADEHDGSAQSRQQALEKLDQFRRGLDRALDRVLSEPASAAQQNSKDIRPDAALGSLARTIRERKLSIGNFHSLLDAFEQDQRVTRYQSLEQLLEYCTKSANPVGRIVLELGGLDCNASESAEIVRKSDAICTALQLVNHCQDVRRDALERDRIYVPLTGTDDAGSMTEGDVRRIAQASGGETSDQMQVERWIAPVLAHARALFSRGSDLPEMLRQHPDARVRGIAPAVHVMLGGGLSIQRLCEKQVGTLLVHRPYVSKLRQMSILGRTMVWRWMPS